jgi:hypothetical protein
MKQTWGFFLRTKWIIWGFVLFLLISPFTLEAGTPHVVYGKVIGNVLNQDQLFIYAYTAERPDELLDKSTVGCGYDLVNNWLWFEVGNFLAPWSIQEPVRVIVVNNDAGETAKADIVLDASGNQYIGDLVLSAGDHVGPITSNAKVDGNSPASIPEGTASIVLTAKVDDAISGNNPIQGAEYYIDTDPGQGTGTTMSAKDNVFDTSQEEVTATVVTSSWNQGETYTLYARGQDIDGNWGTSHKVVVSVTESQGGWRRGDIDHDNDVDRNDLNLILAVLNKPASGPNDERDLNSDAMINILDARILVTLCDIAGCASP